MFLTKIQKYLTNSKRFWNIGIIKNNLSAFPNKKMCIRVFIRQTTLSSQTVLYVGIIAQNNLTANNNI